MTLSIFYCSNCWKRPVIFLWTGWTRNSVHPSRKTPYLRIYRDITRPSITRTWMRWKYVSTGRSYKPWTIVTEGAFSSVAPKFGAKVALWCVHTDWVRSPTGTVSKHLHWPVPQMTQEIYGLLLGLDSVSVNELLGRFIICHHVVSKDCSMTHFFQIYQVIRSLFKKEQVLQFSELS